jgi:hypothetical protein
MFVEDDSLRTTLFHRWSLSSTRRRTLFSLVGTSLTKRTTSSRAKRLLHHRLRLIIIVVGNRALVLLRWQRWSLSSTRRRPLFSLDATSITKRKTFSHAKDCSTDCDSTCYSSRTALYEQRFIAVVAQLYSYATSVLAGRTFSYDAADVLSGRKLLRLAATFHDDRRGRLSEINAKSAVLV